MLGKSPVGVAVNAGNVAVAVNAGSVDVAVSMGAGEVAVSDGSGGGVAVIVVHEVTIKIPIRRTNREYVVFIGSFSLN
jgi:hypothetical protein